MLVFELQGDGEKVVDRGLVVAARAERLFAARHQEAAALFLDIEGNGVEEVAGDFEGGNVVEDDRFCSRELAHPQFAGVANDFESVALVGEDFFEGVGIVFGDQENAGAACDLNPALGDVVAGVGVLDDGVGGGGNDFGAVLVGAGFGETVGEFGFGNAVDEGDGGFAEEGVVAVDFERELFVFCSANGEADDEGFAGLGAGGEGEAGDGVVVGGFVTNKTEVERDALGLELGGGGGEGFGGEAIAEDEDTRRAIFVG